ncbi:MAG: hypothetical protein ACI85K_003596 [Hyphomicrobiaceae bacterium]|jgi:hypothetical protein
MERNQQMSSLARQRMAGMLPGMLGAVRWRRRRRHIVRGSVLAIAAVLLVSYWPGSYWQDRGAVVTPIASVPVAPDASTSQQAASSMVCEVVRDVPGVVDRYRVTGNKHVAWYASDAQLQDFLRDADRPSGIVRVSGRVIVTKAALDPFPLMADE